MLWFIPYSKRREVERMNASNRRGTRSTAQQGVKRSWQEKGEAEPRGENITEANAENSSRNLAKHQRSEEPGGGGSEPPKMAQPQAVRPAIPKVPGANAGEEMQPLPAQHSTLTSGIPPSGPFVPTSTPPGDSSLAAHVSATAYIPSMSPQFQNAMAALHAAYNGGSSPRCVVVLAVVDAPRGFHARRVKSQAGEEFDGSGFIPNHGGAACFTYSHGRQPHPLGFRCRKSDAHGSPGLIPNAERPIATTAKQHTSSPNLAAACAHNGGALVLSSFALWWSCSE